MGEVIAYIRRRMARRSIVVLASGDPLFYGIGAKLVQAFGPERVVIHPNVSSAAAAFARIGQPWQEARVVSCTESATKASCLDLLRSEDTVAVLTDPGHGPAEVGPPAAGTRPRPVADVRARGPGDGHRTGGLA